MWPIEMQTAARTLSAHSRYCRCRPGIDPPRRQPSACPGSPTSRFPTRARRSGNETQPPAAPFGQAVKQRLEQNAADPLSRFFLQLFVVITVSYFVGWIFTRCGQPAVVGEMMAGVLLGPSLFGWLAPHAFQFVFAASSLEPLRLLSQVGVCLFMFAVGMEMDWTRTPAKRLPRLSSLATPALPFPVFSAPDLPTCFTIGWPNPAPLLSPSRSSLPSR